MRDVRCDKASKRCTELAARTIWAEMLTDVLHENYFRTAFDAAGRMRLKVQDSLTVAVRHHSSRPWDVEVSAPAIQAGTFWNMEYMARRCKFAGHIEKRQKASNTLRLHH